MTVMTAPAPSAPARGFATDDERWRAVLARDPRAEDVFWLGVTSTGIFCRPTCAARRPHREHARFFESRVAAQAAGFRPCRRCRPTDEARTQLDVVAQACRILDADDGADPVTLEELGRRVGWSPFHLQRTFRRIVGVTPRQYAEAKRLERLRGALRGADSVTSALYEAGWGSSAAFYATAPAHLGMSPSAYRNGARATGSPTRSSPARSAGCSSPRRRVASARSGSPTRTAACSPTCTRSSRARRASNATTAR
jgi:AraC family transcriptional regulator of adaptative response/methylated-DNA-[protein]-cysteine methyltransferase